MAGNGRCGTLCHWLHKFLLLIIGISFIWNLLCLGIIGISTIWSLIGGGGDSIRLPKGNPFCEGYNATKGQSYMTKIGNITFTKGSPNKAICNAVECKVVMFEPITNEQIFWTGPIIPGGQIQIIPGSQTKDFLQQKGDDVIRTGTLKTFHCGAHNVSGMTFTASIRIFNPVEGWHSCISNYTSMKTGRTYSMEEKFYISV